VKKNYSKVTIILLSVMSLVLGVGVVYLELVSPKAAPGCELDRVQNVPTSTPIMIPPNRPFVLTLVNKNTSEVDVIVTITGTNSAGATIVLPYKIKAAPSSTQGYYKSVIIDLGENLQGPDCKYKIDLTPPNSSGLSNVYAVYSDDAEFAR
jgi:hypothetical protein